MSNLITDPLTFIRQHHPFGALSETELTQIAEQVTSHTFARGTHILRYGGDPSTCLYIIRTGIVRRARDGNVLQVLAEGELFGFPSLINQHESSADVIAEEETTVHCIPEGLFRKLIDNAAFAEFFLKNLSQRLQTKDDDQAPLVGDLTTHISQLIVRPPVLVSPRDTVEGAANAMQQAWVDSALVAGETQGIITGQDLWSRVLARGNGPDTLVADVASYPLKTMEADAPVYAAMLFMLEEDIRHIAVEDNGDVIGIVNATDVLRHQVRSPLYLVHQVKNIEDAEELSRYALDIAATIETLFNGGLDVIEIGRIVATLNDALIRRVLYLVEAELGPPPTPYAWLVFGSEGRMEQALLTDQDNALVYAEDSPEAQEYFAQLSERVIHALIKAGFPPCPGGYMATNWCKPLADWEELFKTWIIKPTPEALLETAIFFDFRAIYGELSTESLEQIILSSRKQDLFIAHLTRSALDFTPPIGFFRGIRAEEGQVDLKKGGVAAIVALARAYALSAGSRTRSTLDRLAEAAEIGTFSKQSAETLAETYRFMLRIRLREQLQEMQANLPPDNKIKLNSLSVREHRHLKEAFLAIREIQNAVSQTSRLGFLG